MQRHTITPRQNWQEKVAAAGLTYHSHEHGPYWDESAYYEFSVAQIDELEAAANTLHELCLDAVEYVVAGERWDDFGLTPQAKRLVSESWSRRDASVYGRFDVAYDGRNPPKLLEYNADTPTALVEASVAQWFWLEEQFKGRDQFNSIHERLIEAWKSFKGERIHFSSVADHPEDEQTVLYLQDTCHQAGLVTKSVSVPDIGWNKKREAFVDLDDQKITSCFKLYPWEWMLGEEFGQYLPLNTTCFIEPPWKMLLSNKALLPLLWKLSPGHPNLLPAFHSPEPLDGNYVVKPKLGREGANVQLHEGHCLVHETRGDYADTGFVYQASVELAQFDGNFPVLGLWIVADEAAGLGIREDASPITTNLSRFVPHWFG